MNTFALEIWDDECPKCNFYTVRLEEPRAGENETDKFFLKYESHEKYREAVNELLQFVIQNIGEKYGAIDPLFNRHENEVKGLPLKGKVKFDTVELHYPNFPLRLYALKLRENIVVLFSGGVKDAATNSESSLHLKWQEACHFARKIDRAIIDQDIIVNEKSGELTDSSGAEEIIIY